VTVVAGSNLLDATSGGPGPDRDYLRVTVPSGLRLTQIKLNAFTSAFDGKAFIGVQAGAAVTVDPANPDPSLLFGYSHFGPDVQPLSPPYDYLPSIGTGVGASGFTGALGPGQYSFWLQQTSAASPSTYQFDFVLEASTPVALPVPLPRWALLAQALVYTVIAGSPAARRARARMNPSPAS
jgi:hypothetical protein